MKINTKTLSQHQITAKPPRYHLIDALRGFALINMLAFHLCYDIFVIFGVDVSWYFSAWAVIWERFICVSFITLSGISLNFSRHFVKRGIIVNLCGFTVTAVTALALPDQAVWFGVLNLIGCSMLIVGALKHPLDKAPPVLGALGSFAMFALSYGIPKHFIGLFELKLAELSDALYQFKYAAYLGFPSPEFRSSDYFPLFPWIFLFAFGYFLWKIFSRLKSEKLDRLLRIKIPVLGFLGKYSLWIYLIHQPVLYGLCALVFSLHK